MTTTQLQISRVVDGQPVLTTSLEPKGTLLGRLVEDRTLLTAIQAPNVEALVKKVDIQKLVDLRVIQQASAITNNLELVKSCQIATLTSTPLSIPSIEKIKPLEILASSNATLVETHAPKKTPLHKHVEYFVNSDGKITQSSLYEGFRKLKLSSFEAFTKSVTIASVAGGIISGCPFARVPADKIHQMVHPCHSGVFKEDGTIDEKAFEDLKKYAQSGKEFLSQHDIQKMREDAINRDKDKDTFGIWQAASAGEWSDLLRIACDHWELIDGQHTPCITFATLKMLFTDGSAIFEKVEKGELPLKKPEIQAV